MMDLMTISTSTRLLYIFWTQRVTKETQSSRSLDFIDFLALSTLCLLRVQIYFV